MYCIACVNVYLLVHVCGVWWASAVPGERERLQFSPRGRVRKFLVITAFDKFGVHNRVLSLVVGRVGKVW